MARKLSLTLVYALTFGCSFQALAGGVDSLHQFLASTQSLKADFAQSVSSRAGRKPQLSSGVMSFSRPGKFRWQIEIPYPQLMVGDGQKFWIYDPELKQVTVRKLGKALGSTPAALLAGKNDLEKNFQLKDDGEKDGLSWVEALPKQAESGFERVRLGFAGAELKAMELFDSFGQTTQLQFSKVQKNPALPPSQFSFQAPAGVDVLGE